MPLQVRDLVCGYGGSTVLHGVDLDLAPGTALGLLGRNGAGKTTLMHTVMGLLPGARGSITLDGAELLGRRPDQIARAGVALVPQGRRIWGTLTVAEHLVLASRRSRRLPGARWTVAAVYELLPRLADRRGQLASHLSGGEQQMLALARALLLGPRLLLLDETSEGLAPAVVDLIAEVMGTLRAEGLSLLVVEQDLHLAFSVCDEIAVMVRGRIEHRAGTAAFRRDPETAHRLLGVA